MVAGWVWVDWYELVGKWFAGRVGWCVGWLVPTTPTPTTNQHFNVKRCALAQNPCKVGVWVAKWKNTSEKMTSTYVQKINEQPQMKKKINNTHQQLHQERTKFSVFTTMWYKWYIFYCCADSRSKFFTVENGGSSWNFWAGHRRKGSTRIERRKIKHTLGW